MTDFNAQIIDEFRSNEGHVGGNFDGAPLLLLHHRGAKSGTERVSPVMYQQVGKDLAVFASKAGAPTNPDWYYNLIAHPDTVVEAGDGDCPGRGPGGRRRGAQPDLGAPEEGLPRLRRLRAGHDEAHSRGDPAALGVLGPLPPGQAPVPAETTPPFRGPSGPGKLVAEVRRVVGCCRCGRRCGWGTAVLRPACATGHGHR